MKQIPMSDSDKRAFAAAMEHARRWCSEHSWQVGAAEAALGVTLLATGVHNGVIEMGIQLVGTLTSTGNVAGAVGSAIGSVLGAGAGASIGSIGVAALGTAIGVPVGLLVVGGAAIFSALGYVLGDAIHSYLNPPLDLLALLGNASLLVVGTALLIDGVRRIIKDKRVRAAASRVRDGVIYLREVSVEGAVTSLTELKALMTDDVAMQRLVGFGSVGLGTAALAGSGGAAVGSSLAVGTVTVLGSHTLGAAALSLGLVSAPIWPALLLGAVGAGVGYAGWRACRTRLIDLVAT